MNCKANQEKQEKKSSFILKQYTKLVMKKKKPGKKLMIFLKKILLKFLTKQKAILFNIDQRPKTRPKSVYFEENMPKNLKSLSDESDSNKQEVSFIPRYILD